MLVDGVSPGQVRQGHRRRLARGDPARAAGRGGRRRAEPVAGLRRGLRRRRHRGGRQAGRRGRAPQPRLDRADRDRRAGRDGPPDRHQRRGRAAGHRAPARRRHHRPDGGGQERARLQPRSSAPSRSARSTSATTRWCRATSTRCAAPSTRRSTGTRPTTTSGRWSPAAGRASPTTTRSRRSRRRAWSTSAWRPAGPTRSGCTSPRLRHPCVGDLTYGADPTLAARLGLTRQWLHARALAFAHPATGGRVSFDSPYPDDLAAALHRLGGEDPARPWA